MLLARYFCGHTENSCLLLWRLALRDHEGIITHHWLYLVDGAIMQGVSLSGRPLILALVDHHETWIVWMIIELGALLIWRKWTVFAVESVWTAIIIILMGRSIKNICSYVVQHLMSCHFLINLFHWHRNMKLWVWFVHLRIVKINWVVASISSVWRLSLFVDVRLIHNFSEWLMDFLLYPGEVFLLLLLQHLIL